MMDFLDLTDKTILIAGGASGIGRATAVLLSQCGAKIILLDCAEQALQDALQQLHGIGHGAVVCDMSELDAIEGVVDNVVAQYGAISGVVHCVGVRCRRPIKMLNPEALNAVMSVNFGSFVELVRSVVRRRCYNKGLSIVAISSISATMSGAGITGYATSKAAIDATVRCLAKELAPKGIRVNSVVPGQVNTETYRTMMSANGGGQDTVLERQYLGLGNPEDVASAVAFLLSPRSRLTTGAAVPLDGGFFTA